MEKKTCKDCGEEKPLVDFRLHSKHSKYRRSYCNPCHNRRSGATAKKRLASKTVSAVEKNKRRNERRAEFRRDPNNRAAVLYEDCKKSDKKKGRSFDLSIDEIADLIHANECSYCGESDLMMSLDRIDNTEGHTKGNVKPSCLRCNLMRGSIPYPAWEVMIPAVREARTKGLFGDWTGAIRRP